MSITDKTRWWQRKEPSLRKDIYDALVALREHVENLNSKHSVVLSHLDTYRQRQLTEVHVTRVQEWEFGYQVKVLNEVEGFYVRTIFVKLHGGRLDEIQGDERRQIIDAVSEAVLDKGSEMIFEGINDTTFAIRQPFAVMFWNEGNPNIPVPSQAYFKKAFSLPKINKG